VSDLLFRDVVLPERDLQTRFDVRTSAHAIAEIEPAGRLAADEDVDVVDGDGLWLLPGFIDDHVHLREPGLVHKEGYEHGTRAAAAGGVTTLLEIQNNPPLVVDRRAAESKLEIVRPKSLVNIGIYGTLVRESLGEVGGMADLVAGYKLFMGPSTGDIAVGKGELMRALFEEVARTGHWLFVHAEDGALIEQGLAEHGAGGAAAFHLARPAAAEITATRDALGFGEAVGTRVHVFHVSTAGAVDLVEAARARGQAVTAGTCLHYLYFTHEDTARLGPLLKVNPSIKTAADRDRLLEGLTSGAVDCLSSDHAPHAADEKERDFELAPSGIPCLDVYMPLCLTLVERGMLSLQTVLDRAAHAPAELHGFLKKGRVEVGHDADLVLCDPKERRAVRGAEHFSRARHTPYEGMELVGWPRVTVVMGRVVHRA